MAIFGFNKGFYKNRADVLRDFYSPSKSCVKEKIYKNFLLFKCRKIGKFVILCFYYVYVVSVMCNFVLNKSGKGRETREG